jgi:hypothetical protein
MLPREMVKALEPLLGNCRVHLYNDVADTAVFGCIDRLTDTVGELRIGRHMNRQFTIAVFWNRQGCLKTQDGYICRVQSWIQDAEEAKCIKAGFSAALIDKPDIDKFEKVEKVNSEFPFGPLYHLWTGAPQLDQPFVDYRHLVKSIICDPPNPFLFLSWETGRNVYICVGDRKFGVPVSKLS